MKSENTGRVLIVEDDSDLALTLRRSLSRRESSFCIEIVTSASKLKQRLKQLQPDVVLLDLVLSLNSGTSGGLENISLIKRLVNHARIIVLTGHGNVELGIKALHLGAASFLQKPPDIDHLFALVKDAVTQARMLLHKDSLELGQRSDMRNLIAGESDSIERVREDILFYGSTDQPLLIMGETGTGKSLCARALHRFGARSGGRFVRYQSTLSSRDLESSELFGHSRGAFTGAGESRSGLVQQADGGTLFLDEIDSFESATQVLLLNALQDGTIRRVGENEERTVDFRLVCATNASIEQALESGRIRRDFYHRIAHATIELPSLRERLEDIPSLVRAFLREDSKLSFLDVSEDFLRELAGYEWPGNLRQLKAVVEDSAYRAIFKNRLVISTDDLRLKKLAKRNGFSSASELGSTGNFKVQVEEFKKKLILETLAKFKGNQTQAAKFLEMDRTSFRRALQKYRTYYED